MSGLTLEPLIAAFVVLGVLLIWVSARRNKRSGTPRWDPRPPNVRERATAGIYLAAFVAALANYFADWQLLGGYDKWALIGLFVGGLLLIDLFPRVARDE